MVFASAMSGFTSIHLKADRTWAASSPGLGCCASAFAIARAAPAGGQVRHDLLSRGLHAVPIPNAAGAYPRVAWVAPTGICADCVQTRPHCGRSPNLRLWRKCNEIGVFSPSCMIRFRSLSSRLAPSPTSRTYARPCVRIPKHEIEERASSGDLLVGRLLHHHNPLIDFLVGVAQVFTAPWIDDQTEINIALSFAR